MLAPSKAVIEDTWEWLRAVLMLRPWSWFISPGQFGFVRVDNQFGNSPFYSGAAWVWFFFGGCMACPLCLSFFSPFCMRRNWNCCLQISVGRFSPRGLCGNRYIVVVYSLLYYLH
jgi:hypothetical protein